MLQKEAKRIVQSNKSSDYDGIQKSMKKLYDGMQKYANSIKEKIPLLSQTMTEGVLHTLRAIRIVDDNDLQQQLVVRQEGSTHVADLITAIQVMIKHTEELNFVISKWTSPNLDIDIQKRIIVALHADLITSQDNTITLLKKLQSELEL